MYIRMVIGEAMNEDQVREFRTIYKDASEPEILNEPGIVGGEIMFEESGTMVRGSDQVEHSRRLPSLSVISRLPSVCGEDSTPFDRKLRCEAFSFGIASKTTNRYVIR